jgi:hypothetical protein
VAGHGLLDGCTQPWNHDGCPGYLPSPEAPDGAPRMGGLACHCPCHGLRDLLATYETDLLAARREISRLRAELNP